MTLISPIIRYVKKSDKPQISEINLTAPFCYNISSEIRSSITWVIEQEGYIIGYLSYQAKSSSINIGYIGVRQELRQCGYGSMLLCRLYGNAINANKTIAAKVHSDDLDSQLFFKYNGFRAIAIINEYYEHYLMEWSKEGNVLSSCLR